MHVHVIADGFGDATAQTAFVRAAGVCADPVDVAADPLIGRLGPLQGDLDERHALFLFRIEDRLVNRLAVVVGDQLFEVGLDALGVMKDVRFALVLVAKLDLQPAVDVRDVFQVLADDLGAEMDVAKDLRVGAEVDLRAMPAERADLLHRRGGTAAFVTLHPLVSVAMHDGDEFLRKRIGHR